MARSLGLAAYRAIARRGEPQYRAPDVPRPDGELVWIHAAEPGNMIAVMDLANRLCATRFGLKVLITQPGGESPQPSSVQPDRTTIVTGDLPDEHPTSVAAFLDHWQPDTCIWVWGALLPNLVLATSARHCPMFLIDAANSGFDGRRDRWLPSLTRYLLPCFTAILTRSDAGLRRLGNLGMTRDRITVTSPLLAGGQVLPCADSDLVDMSAAIGGRPVWFATQVQPAEVPVVLSAHRKAVRLSHRLLLILNTAIDGDGDAAVHQAAERGFDVRHWAGVNYPDDTTQVLVADDPGDIGLFYRMAPVSFLGSSLTADHGGCDPLEAAALGSAVLYGPKVRHHLPSYTRLAAAGAARIVNDATALGIAVSRLIAPDQAATMAHAGWDVVSQGAALTDQVIDLVQDALDQRIKAG